MVSTLASLLLTPVLNAQAAGVGQPAVEGSPVAQVMNVVVMLLGIAGVVMTYLKPARPYFAPKPLGY